MTVEELSRLLKMLPNKAEIKVFVERYWGDPKHKISRVILRVESSTKTSPTPFTIPLDFVEDYDRRLEGERENDSGIHER